ncbi:MAG: hypothetical protein ABR979_05820 [Halobacteriota archaeon]|jgi:hypothetical protein
MAYKDLQRRRDYDKAYKRRQRAQSWTRKGLDKCLTERKFETVEDFRGKLNQIWAETCDAKNASLKPETRLRIQLRVVEVGLRLIETADCERRITALEERENGSTPLED